MSKHQTNGTIAPAAIGIDPDFSDCVIKAKSGTFYYTSKGVMATCSPIFRGLVECCDQSQSVNKNETPLSPGSENEELNAKYSLEIPLEDRDEEIATLVEHLHQPHRFWQSVVPNVTKEGAARILLLTPIAFKYDIEGRSASSFTAYELLVRRTSIV